MLLIFEANARVVVVVLALHVGVVDVELTLVVALAPVGARPVHAVVGVATFSRGLSRGLGRGRGRGLGRGISRGRGRGLGRGLGRLDAVVNCIFGRSRATENLFVVVAVLANQEPAAVSIVVAVTSALSQRVASRSPTLVRESLVVGRQILWIVAVVQRGNGTAAATWNAFVRVALPALQTSTALSVVVAVTNALSEGVSD